MILTVFILIVTIYLIKLISDYRKWVKNFYSYPSYTITFSDSFSMIKDWLWGFDFLMNKYTSKSFFNKLHQYTKHHDIFVLWIWYIPLVWILKPNLVETTLKMFNIKTIFQTTAKPPIADGLFMMSGSKWKKFRKIGEINLRTKMLSKFFPIMSYHTDQLVDKLTDPKLNDDWIDLNEPLSLTTFNVICECAMGVSTESIESQLKSSALQMFELIDQAPVFLVKRVLAPYLWPQFIWTRYIKYASEGKISVFDSLFKYVTNQEINRQRAINEANNNNQQSNDVTKQSEEEKSTINVNHIKNNLLSHMVNLYLNQNHDPDDLPEDDNDNNDLITPIDIENEVNNFILAGFETVKTAALWTLVCIASEPAIENRIYDELIEVFGDSDNEWTFDLDNLNQLTFLDCCIREGLRLFSPLQVLGRNTGSDHYQINADHCLPPNTEYLVSVYSIHHDETIYPEPEKFDPDRWSTERVKTIPPNCYLPFGTGPRTCVGYRFALYEMKIVISLIVKRFRISTDQHYRNVDWIFPITVKPVKPSKFKLTPRTKST